MIDIIRANIFPEEILAGTVLRSVSTINNLEFDGRSKDHIFVLQSNLKISKPIITQKQIHSDIVNFAINDKEQIGDALISDDKFFIGTKVADCSAVLILDKKNKLIANVHSGWKGTKQRIVTKTLLKMKNDYGTNLQDTLVYLSPSASLEKYEVGDEFLNFFPSFVQRIGSKFYFDNKTAIKFELISLGVKEKNIEISPICSISDQRCHSFRRDGEKSRRMLAFIGFKD